ncbi:Early light-induced protein 2 [Abeliophyllum distichum]|uniref:Early light-induced protein 2 n=1 Tax=Abeliophyllum distichum TaxID=126358 RepID=A0ABD1RFR5_9LAMI
MAAVSSVMLLSPATGLTKKNGLKQFLVPSYVPSLNRNANLRVSSTAEDNEKEQLESSSSAAPPKSFPLKPKVSTDFGDILAFSGPGPERINGRLAMIGFVTAIGVELANGKDLFAQIQSGGIPWFIGTSVVLSAASLIPLLKGVRAESKSNGVMTSDAELWNGRFAMLGLIALAFTEYVKGGALV